MKRNKGVLAINILIIVLVIISGVISYIFFISKGKNFDPINLNLEDSISNLISEELNLKSDDLSVKVLNRDGVYAVGEVTDYRNQEKMNFYAVFVNSVWRLIEVDNDVSCEKLESLGFSEEGLYGCQKRYPDSKTVKEIVEDEETADLSSIIGRLDSYDPSGDATISSGGESITVSFSGDISEVQIGDVVLVTVDNEKIEDTSLTNITAKKIENLEEDDDSSEELYQDSINDDGEDDYLDGGDIINEPPTSSDERDRGYNIFDLDQEYLIRLRND